ncbi:sigma-54-dependent transcriptional regulator [Paraburkholderia ginsengisoli]|uniref:Sigma-54-dependent Fis family transcriptional regulator n=1 Tax=Paraburkholderia ginsengisoli TaxID=311231 RepID=A0A7T4N5R1_9BURK|nr:sigma-54 dependent transcriptional regulator [Paraburkholderia ginsengisoli]QQC65740.1 sigma-54-dependent Fis family transcriptional regulator [Paraburkholderia ginsengisoli]
MLKTKAMTQRVVYFTREPVPGLLADIVERDWEVEVVGSIEEVRRAMRVGTPVGALVDLSSVLDLYEARALEDCLAQPDVSWVAMASAAQLDDPTARRLVREYCFDYVTLPAANARILDTVGHACGMVSLGESTRVDTAVGEGKLVGNSDAMLALFDRIGNVAAIDAPVFIAGESGTGKELTAAAIHARSSRRHAPFVVINCGSISPDLLQAELFGYERSAFDSANRRRIGRIESANGGTLFLDGIGDLPYESQASLLRFMQESMIDVDVRIMCATHVDMDAAIEAGRFRADLYYRVCVSRIDVPPLRTRGNDIELLALDALDRHRKDARRRLSGFSPDAIAAMRRYAWPGNVRELINRVQRAVVMSEGRAISAADLDLSAYAAAAPLTLAYAREAAERQALELALLRHRGRPGDAARELSISRATLYRLLAEHGMRYADECLAHG